MRCMWAGAGEYCSNCSCCRNRRRSNTTPKQQKPTMPTNKKKGRKSGKKAGRAAAAAQNSSAGSNNNAHAAAGICSESKQQFETRLAGYAARNHGVIITPGPACSQPKLRGMKVEVLGYDDATKIVDVQPLEPVAAEQQNDITPGKLQVTPVSLVEDLPSFPGPETTEQKIERLLGYKYTSLSVENTGPHWRNGGQSCKLSKNYSSLKGDILRLEIGTTRKVLDPNRTIPYDIVPDYDRETAEWPIFSRMGRLRINWARRAMACVDSVPTASRERDVYKKFLECDRECMDINVLFDGVNGGGYVTMDLLGEYAGERFVLISTGKGYDFSFTGSLEAKCRDKYHHELSYYLAHECMTYIEESEEGASPQSNLLVRNILLVFRAVYLRKQRFKELIAITVKMMDMAICDQSSLEVVAKIANELGEYLEAQGMHEPAAHVYAEAGVHLREAGHALASVVLGNSALAWKRSRNLEEAERYYALALQSLRFFNDPQRYHDIAFHYLRNIFCMYDDNSDVVPMKIPMAVRALLEGAGEELPPSGGTTYFHDIRTDLCLELRGVGKERIVCLIQSIIDASTSPEAMRKAIADCADHDGVWCDFKSSDWGADDRKGYKNTAREFVKNHYPAPYIQTCDACGELKEERDLEKCSCKRAYYCHKECQRAHWSFHRAECKSARRAKA